jgi:hypothetical protein
VVRPTLGMSGVTVGMDELGGVVIDGLCTKAGFSYVVEGLALVGLTLGKPGVTVGVDVLGVVVMGGLCTEAGFS